MAWVVQGVLADPDGRLAGGAMATVLIVPRDTLIADLVAEFARAAGHGVVFATDDVTAPRSAERAGADVVLVDIEHMDLAEAEVARRLQSADLPVIAFSGRLVDEELELIAGRWVFTTFALPNTMQALDRAVGAAIRAAASRDVACPTTSGIR
jgi:DNA-binding response OmpR family regulator